MDTDQDARQGGPDGDPAPRPRPGDGGEEPGGSGTRLLNEEGAPPDRPHTPVRPYRHHAVTDLEAVLRFGEWLQEDREEADLGVASDGASLGFASEEEGWFLPEAAGVVADALRGVLTSALDSRRAPLLISRSIERDLPALAARVEVPAAILTPLFRGDLSALCRTLGRPFHGGGFPSPADDAYEALTAEGYWRKGAPSYYAAVAVPAARQRALARLAAPEGGWAEWRVAYEDLFLRVLAHYTRDPVLVRSFLDGENPLPEVTRLLELEGEEQAYAVLFWTALGFDTVYLQEGYPKTWKELPEGLDQVRQRIERKMPVLRVGVVQAIEDHIRERGMKTLYGRRIGWQAHAAVGLHHRFLGSVEDLVEVAQVALAPQGEDVWQSPVSFSPTDRAIRVRGRAADRARWHEVLKKTAALGGPISVPLDPAIVWE